MRSILALLNRFVRLSKVNVFMYILEEDISQGPALWSKRLIIMDQKHNVSVVDSDLFRQVLMDTYNRSQGFA